MNAEAMDLEKLLEDDPKARTSSPCSICLELVIDLAGRSLAKLQCGHEFHLDCIGSAFNAKGVMQCPNCRQVEKGQWLYANGPRPSPDFDLDGWVAEDGYDLSYSDLPFGMQWCPIRGLPQLASLLEEGEHPLHSLFRDHPSTANTRICPYLALHGFPPVHPAPSSAADSIPENGPFHRHPTNLLGPFSGDMINSYNFSATEQQIHNWQQQPPVAYSAPGNPDQSVYQLASRLSRTDNSTQQRLGSFVRPHTFLRGNIMPTGNNMVSSLGQPVTGEVRSHSRRRGGPTYQQPMSSSSLHAAAFAPIRRTSPRTLAILSSNVSSSVDISGFYGFSSGSVNRNHQNVEGIGRNNERFYGWGREGESAPLPWIFTEGESQWQGPFHPSHNPLPGSADSMARNFFPTRAVGERITQNLPDNIYHHMPPPGMPPYM